MNMYEVAVPCLCRLGKVGTQMKFLSWFISFFSLLLNLSLKYMIFTVLLGVAFFLVQVALL